MVVCDAGDGVTAQDLRVRRPGDAQRLYAEPPGLGSWLGGKTKMWMAPPPQGVFFHPDPAPPIII